MTTRSDVPAGGSPTPTMFCTTCGRPATGGAFCGACGAQVQIPVARSEAPTVIDLTRPREIELPRQERAELPHEGTGADQEQGIPHDAVALGPEDEGDSSWWWTRLSRGARASLVGGAVLLALALVAGVVVGVSWFGDRDVRAALAAGQSPYGEVLRSLEGAQDLAAVVAVAGRAESLAPVVEGRARSIAAGNDDYAQAAEAQLLSEAAVLSAAAELTRLDAAPLDTWGDAHPRLVEALEAEAEARAELAEHDGVAVDGLPLPGEVLAGAASAVAPELSSDAAGRARQLLTTMQAATRTGQLRDLAGTAGAQRDGVDAVAGTLPDGPDKTTLMGMAEALGALGGLGSLSGEDPGPWQGSRAGVSAGITQVASGSGDAALSAALPAALAAVDRMVEQASAAIADWRAQTQAATEARDADALALKEYADGFRTSMAQYSQLRQDLSAFTARVEDPTTFVSPYDGFQYMQQAAEDREGIRDSLNWMTVPADARGAHTEVVAVVDRSIRAVQSGYDGLEQWWYCTDCDYRETPGWTTFQKESDAITKAFGASVEGWEAAVSAAQASISSRALPAKPEV